MPTATSLMPSQKRHINRSVPDAAAVIIEAATGSAATRALDLVTDCAPAALEIAPACLRKITEELVGNAVKFSPSGSPLRVSTKLDGAGYHLYVEDCGRGMSDLEIANVSAFRQFNRSRFEQQGLGLGLYLASRLAAWNGGSIEIQSQPEGGTTVHVSLR